MDNLTMEMNHRAGFGGAREVVPWKTPTLENSQPCNIARVLLEISGTGSLREFVQWIIFYLLDICTLIYIFQQYLTDDIFHLKNTNISDRDAPEGKEMENVNACS